jgi:hypothetical protein
LIEDINFGPSLYYPPEPRVARATATRPHPHPKEFAMKRLVLAALMLSSAVLTAAAAGDIPTNAPRSSPAPTPPPAAGRLVVHEWGTFTGFAGSDGTHLPFRSDVGADLPGFILTRAAQHHRLNPADVSSLLDLSKDGLLAMQRMETPVVYFYADAPRDVDVRVEFPQGLLTEFYPPVRAMAPAYKGSREKLSDSSLDWGRVRIVPGDAGTRVPKIENNNHYRHARETDAALVQFSDKPGETHEEKFLFYRGVGNFTLPVALAATGGDHFVLQTSGEDPIGAVFLVRVEDGRTRFSAYHNVRGRLEMKLPPAGPGMVTDAGAQSAGLGEALVTALVGQGLYEKEARAMVKTWESSWFAEKGTGTRLLYTLPRRATDSILPLTVTPTPDETVRVLVGRIDLLTPEQEAKLAAMLPRAETAGAITAQEARDARGLGRFLRPALDRAAKVQADKLLSAVYRTPE